MTASVTILTPRKPKRLASITYPPELLPVPGLGDDVSIIVKCNRPDCIGEGCRYCGIVKFQAKKGKKGKKGKKP